MLFAQRSAGADACAHSQGADARIPAAKPSLAVGSPDTFAPDQRPSDEAAVVATGQWLVAGVIDCLAAEPSVHACPAPPSDDQDTRADARNVWHHMLTCSSSGEWKQGGATWSRKCGLIECRASNRAHCMACHPLQAPRTRVSCCCRYLQPSAVLRVQTPAVPQADLQRGEAGGTHWRILLHTASRCSGPAPHTPAGKAFHRRISHGSTMNHVSVQWSPLRTGSTSTAVVHISAGLQHCSRK